MFRVGYTTEEEEEERKSIEHRIFKIYAISIWVIGILGWATCLILLKAGG